MIEEGQTVPKFEASDANGNKVKSTDFKGKKHVVITSYSIHYTKLYDDRPACRRAPSAAGFGA